MKTIVFLAALWAASSGENKTDMEDQKNNDDIAFAVISDFPFVVALVENRTALPMCTGVLITKQKTLTACQCLGVMDVMTGIVEEPLDPGDGKYYVSAGAVTVEKIGSPNAKKVIQFDLHPNCTQIVGDVWRMDTGIVTVEAPFTIVKGKVEIVPFAPLCTDYIAKTWKDLKQNGTCHEIGFGVMDASSSRISSVMSRKRLRIKPNSVCSLDLKNASLADSFDQSGISCATVTNQTAIAASDSGGPIMCGNEYHGLFLGSTNAKDHATSVLIAQLDSFINFLLKNGVPPYPDCDQIDDKKTSDEPPKYRRLNSANSIRIRPLTFGPTFLFLFARMV